MAILRVHKKRNKTSETPNTPNATTPTADAEELARYLDRFRSRLTTADDVDELVREIISQHTAKHLVVFYLDEEHGIIA